MQPIVIDEIQSTFYQLWKVSFTRHYHGKVNMNFCFRIQWDNPLWIFCNRGSLISQDNKYKLLQFEERKSEDIILFDVKEIGEVIWRWKHSYNTGNWSVARSGELVTNDGSLLAKVNICLPNRTRTYKTIKSKVLEVSTINEHYYTIEWETSLFLGVISKNDTMTLYDTEATPILVSVTPPAYNKFRIIGESNDIMMLATIFTAYHLKIPMPCIGDD
jgi:hypothetical protein